MTNNVSFLAYKINSGKAGFFEVPVAFPTHRVNPKEDIFSFPKESIVLYFYYLKHSSNLLRS